MVDDAFRVYHKVVSVSVHDDTNQHGPAGPKASCLSCHFSGQQKELLLKWLYAISCKEVTSSQICANARGQEEDGRGRRRQVFCSREPSKVLLPCHSCLWDRQQVGGCCSLSQWWQKWELPLLCPTPGSESRSSWCSCDADVLECW